MNGILTFSEFKRLDESVSQQVSSEQVKSIQTALKAKGYGALLGTSGPAGDGVDGVLGPNTATAIKKFQQDNALKTDGIVGPQTSAKLGVQPLPVAPKPVAPAAQAAPVSTDNIVVSDSLNNNNIHFDFSKETTPFTCTETGCSQWVSDTLDQLGVNRQGNAWHAQSIESKLVKYTAFKNFDSAKLTEMGKIFTLINANYTNAQVAEAQVKNLLKSLIPDQASLKPTMLINDVIGLYYDKSTNFTKAFFEGATGYDNMGAGTRITNGPYFIHADTKAAWQQADLGKNVQFVAGKTITNGGGFGFNTHLGFVGATVNGEPIIFHNIHGKVHSTPFSKMTDIKVMWIKSGTGASVNRQVSPYLKNTTIR